LLRLHGEREVEVELIVSRPDDEAVAADERRGDGRDHPKDGERRSRLKQKR
jgi:hypothetical protein